MNWKKFFRPTISKIITFIFVSIVFIPFIEYGIEPRIICIKAPCPSGAEISFLQYLLSSDSSYRTYYISYSISYSTLVIGLIISYLVSCAIIFGINKLKKK